MVHRIAVTALSLCFAVGTLSASYHACEKEPIRQPPMQTADMAGMDCASMGMTPAPKAEKKCCIDFSCPKCFSSPLTTARLTTEQPVIKQVALQLPAETIDVTHSGFSIDRPPKAA